MAERAAKSLMIQFKSSVGLGSSNSAGDGHTDHRVVAGTDQTHHLDVSRDGGGASELGITVHTAHGVRQAVGSRARGHVVRVQRAARAAAGGHGEVFFAVLHRPFFIGAGNHPRFGASPALTLVSSQNAITTPSFQNIRSNSSCVLKNGITGRTFFYQIMPSFLFIYSRPKSRFLFSLPVSLSR